MEKRACKNCKKYFIIDERDQDYYKKINVPEPTWCPKCRMIRRMATVNTFSVFWRNCDKCGKRTLSMYPPTQKIIVYCQPCWWSDEWDGTEYGMEYDPSRPFLEQMKELSEKVPYAPLDTDYLTLTNCEYSNGLAYSKNCLLAAWADYCENVCHSSFLKGIKDSSDCLRMQDSELCYESMGQNKAYRVFYSEECDASTDVWFSRNCYNCINCVGCVNLRGGSYQIFNQQYSKEEYAEKIKALKLDTYSGIKAFEKEAKDFWKTLPYRAYSGNTFNVNTTGEYVYGSKNSKEMYLSNGAEDCRRCQFITVAPARDCVDYSGWGNNAQLIYESASIGAEASNVKFSYSCFANTMGVEYSEWCVGGKNILGCASLKRRQYAILNKVYLKEEYEKLREKIIAEMKANPYKDAQGRVYPYGEFLPPEFSNFAYNTSNAHKFFPKTKEEAEKAGYWWYEEPEAAIEATIASKDLPETISEVGDGILKEIISCGTCLKKYRIAELEYQLLRKMNMPLPRECPKCRDKRRFSALNPIDLFDRECAKCGKEIVSAFSPDRPETVYCVECYQKELV